MMSARCQEIFNLIINIISFKRRIMYVYHYCDHNNTSRNKKYELKINKIFMSFRGGVYQVGSTLIIVSARA